MCLLKPVTLPVLAEYEGAALTLILLNEYRATPLASVDPACQAFSGSGRDGPRRRHVNVSKLPIYQFCMWIRKCFAHILWLRKAARFL